MIRVENVLKISLQDLLKMSWRRLEEVLKTSWKRLEDVLKTSSRHLENVLKTSWRRMAKTNIFVLTKTSWRRSYGQDEYIGLDQDVLKTSWRRLLKKKTSSSRRMFAGLLSWLKNLYVLKHCSSNFSSTFCWWLLLLQQHLYSIKLSLKCV